MIRAVVFDVDGTLVDSVDLHAAAWQQAFRAFGREIPFDKVRRQIGKGADHLLPVFLAPDELRREGAQIAATRDALWARDFAPRVRPFPAVRPLLARLTRDGRRVVLASSSQRRDLDATIGLLGVGDLLAATVSADDASRSKPSPDVFEAALDQLGAVDLREVVVVGDTPYDAEAAAVLGVASLGLLCGGFPEMDLIEAGCAEIYRDPADLLLRYDASMLSPSRRRLAG